MGVRRPVEKTAGPSTSLRFGRDDNSCFSTERVPKKGRHPEKITNSEHSRAPALSEVEGDLQFPRSGIDANG